MVDWQIKLFDLNAGSAKALDVHFKSMKFGYVLNGPGSFEADLVLTNEDSIRDNWLPGATEIRVLRNDVLVWGGYLWGRSIEMRDTMTVRGEGYLSWLRKRLVTSDLIYEDEPQEDIVWGLVNHTQTQHGTLEITRGAHGGATELRDRDYCANQHPVVGDSMLEFTNLYDGLDMEITPTPGDSDNKVLRTFNNMKGDDLSDDVYFNDGNLRRLSFEESADEMATRVITDGNDDCNPESDDRTSINTDTYGMQMVAQQLDEGDRIRDVRGYGMERIRHGRTPQWMAEIEYIEHADAARAWGAFMVGDVIRVSNERGDPFDKNFRVLVHDTHVEASGKVFYTATIDSTTTGDIS